MKLIQVCEVEECTKDHDVIFSVEGAFDVSLCDEHALDLREAVFNSDPIFTGIQVSKEIENHQFMQSVVERAVVDVNAPDEGALRKAHARLTLARRDLFNSVMQWLRKK